MMFFWLFLVGYVLIGLVAGALYSRDHAAHSAPADSDWTLLVFLFWPIVLVVLAIDYSIRTVEVLIDRITKGPRRDTTTS